MSLEQASLMMSGNETRSLSVLPALEF